MRISKGTCAILVIFLVLLLDQALKFWVKTHMELGESIKFTNWFYLSFTENNGMAFGWEFFDKIFLTIFRIAASIAIAWYLFRLRRSVYKTGYVVCIALIFAGAVGNIIDCVFYGVIFNGSYGQVAAFFPPEGGYAPLLHGRVVDMFYFPLVKTTWPAWVPYWGGEEFVFFRPVFNIADASISVGVVVLLLFYRKTLSQSLEQKKVHE